MRKMRSKPKKWTKCRVKDLLMVISQFGVKSTRSLRALAYSARRENTKLHVGKELRLVA